MTAQLCIPKITDSSFELLKACGHLRHGHKDMLERLQRLGDKGTCAAKFGAGKNAFFLLFLGGQKDTGHLHLDVVRKSCVRNLSCPVFKLSELIEPLSFFIGATIDVHLLARYVIKKSVLPPKGLIMSSMTDRQFEGLRVARIGEKLAIKGSPISQLEWEQSPSGDQVRVEFEVERRTTIGENYLQELTELAHSTLRLFILDVERENENAEPQQ